MKVSNAAGPSYAAGISPAAEDTAVVDESSQDVNQEAAETGAKSTVSGSAESDLSATLMRTMLNSMHADLGRSGSGGITQQPPVADPIRGEGYTEQEKKEIIDTLRQLYGTRVFKALSAEDRSNLLRTLASNAPITLQKMSATINLLSSAESLSPAEHKLVIDGFRASRSDPAYARNLDRVINSAEFAMLTDEERIAVLSQTRNYPDARSVANIERLLAKPWFKSDDLGDKQRSLKTVARLSQHPPRGNEKIINNTLDKLVGAGSHFKLDWKSYPLGDEVYYGEAGGDTLHLNKRMIASNNEKMAENFDTNHLVLDTVAHEINHLMNPGKVDNTFEFFESEYRGWYVGFQAHHGRVPTNEEAMQQRLIMQLDPDNFYGKYAAGAMRDPVEARKIFDLLEQVTGMKVDAHNWQAVIKSDPVSWPNLSLSPAPVPSGNIDNH